MKKSAPKPLPPAKEKTEKICYSKEELQEFKELLLKKKEKAENIIKRLRKDNKNENDTTDTAPEFRAFPEGGQKTNSIHENNVHIERQERYIKKLDNALIRIENRTYGIETIKVETKVGNEIIFKEVTRLISKDRLRIVPHATKSVEKKMLEKSEMMNAQKAIGKFDKTDIIKAGGVKKVIPKKG